MEKKAETRSCEEREGLQGALNVLVYGAGVLGSLYAARLQQSGCNVSILARGQRFAELRERGILLEDARTGKQTHTHVHVVEHLMPEDVYDLVIVLMGRHQVSAVLPVLAANQHTPNILFMVNNAAGPDVFLNTVGSERILLGFAGAGGTREAGVVRASILSSLQQATTLGELDGRSSLRLDQVVSTFKRAGFPIETSSNMDAWLKTHVAWIIPTATALYLRSHPEVSIQVRKEVMSATAEIASPEKRRELWSRLLQVEPLFANYEKQAAGREIPIVLVRPVNSM